MMAYETYQIRAYASPSGYAEIDRVLEITRKLYNNWLEQSITARKESGKPIRLFDLYNQLTALRKADAELDALDTGIERGTAARLYRAFQGYFNRRGTRKKPGFPRFKSATRWNTLEHESARPGMLRRAGKKYRLKIKGLPALELRSKRELPSSDKLKTIRITRRGRRLDVGLTFDVEKTPLPPSECSVGLDLGVSSRIVSSDGEHIPGVKENGRRKRRLQRKVSRAKKGSRNRAKKKAMLSRETRRQAVRERNATHRLSTRFVRKYKSIFIEKLNISNMTRSARGTADKPGKEVSAKAKLNSGILRNRWGQLRTQLAYKAEWAGRELKEVDPKYTSQDCSRCGKRNPGKTPERMYTCADCGLRMDRDENAAKNILARGLGLRPHAPKPALAGCT